MTRAVCGVGFISNISNLLQKPPGGPSGCKRRESAGNKPALPQEIRAARVQAMSNPAELFEEPVKRPGDQQHQPYSRQEPQKSSGGPGKKIPQLRTPGEQDPCSLALMTNIFRVSVFMTILACNRDATGGTDPCRIHTVQRFSEIWIALLEGSHRLRAAVRGAGSPCAPVSMPIAEIS